MLAEFISSRLFLIFFAFACGDDDRRPADGGARDGASDADDGSDVGPTPDAERPVCETLSAQAEPVPATLLFQVDTSNSMNCPVESPACLTDEPTPAPDDSRWDVFTAELRAALSAPLRRANGGSDAFPAVRARVHREYPDV